MQEKVAISKKLIITLAASFAILCVGGALFYFLWFLPRWQAPLVEPLNLPTVVPSATAIVETTPLPTDVPTETPIPAKKPLCGDDTEWIFLLVGVDGGAKGNGYLYGLADVIRVVRVDFTEPSVNVVSIPRTLLIDNPPTSLTVEGPILLNQAYLFGTEGMGKYTGSGYGAGSLAETIQQQFGVTPEHYLVVNFQAFVKFIDAIGGIYVDLPTYVDDRPRGFFPAGLQYLKGEEALTLARARKKYSDNIRINNQTIILQGIFNRLKDPTIIGKLPEVYTSLQYSVVTDLSPNQIQDAFCLFTKLVSTDISYYAPGDDLMSQEWALIPTMGFQMYITRWDERMTQWINNSLFAAPK